MPVEIDEGLKASELLPCPFCGGPARAWEASEMSSCPSVWCQNTVTCGANVSLDDEKLDAITAWNTRQPDPRVSVLLSAVGLCQAQFEFYANEHRAAGKLVKAETNQRYADLCTEALATFKGVPTQPACEHDWEYTGTDYHGSHKGEDAYRCRKCPQTEYRP